MPDRGPRPEPRTAPLGQLSAGLLRLGRSERAHRLVTTSPAAREVARRFIAADDTAGVLDLVAGNWGKGLEATLEPLLVPATTREDAARATRRHLELLQALGERGLGEAAEVTVKLTTLGLQLPRDGRSIAVDNLAQVCRAARNHGSQVSLDLEDHTTVDDTFAAFTQLHQDHPRLGVTVQSQLRRSLVDCRWLSTMGVRVRLCKGGYSEPRSVAFGDAQEIDENFVRCLRVLVAGKGYPMIATHDPRLVAIADELADRSHRSRADYEFQMYHGVRPWEHRRLVDTGHRVQVHLPVGESWYPYLAHRVAERPANVMPLLRALVTRR